MRHRIYKKKTNVSQILVSVEMLYCQRNDHSVWSGPPASPWWPRRILAAGPRTPRTWAAGQRPPAARPARPASRSSAAVPPPPDTGQYSVILSYNVIQCHMTVCHSVTICHYRVGVLRAEQSEHPVHVLPTREDARHDDEYEHLQQMLILDM